jgi:hypothetical protein
VFWIQQKDSKLRYWYHPQPLFTSSADISRNEWCSLTLPTQLAWLSTCSLAYVFTSQILWYVRCFWKHDHSDTADFGSMITRQWRPYGGDVTRNVLWPERWFRMCPSSSGLFLLAHEQIPRSTHQQIIINRNHLSDINLIFAHQDHASVKCSNPWSMKWHRNLLP